MKSRMTYTPLPPSLPPSLPSFLPSSLHQFGFQEPDPVEKVRKDMKDRFGVTFPIYNKVDVNGAGAHPLFAALKEYEPELSNHNPKLSWNFTVRRHSSMGSLSGIW